MDLNTAYISRYWVGFFVVVVVLWGVGGGGAGLQTYKKTLTSSTMGIDLVLWNLQ